MTSVSHRSEEGPGFIGALRRLRDPLLLFLLPIAFAALSIVLGHLNSWPIGFDFRGTLWEPARALLDGGAIYPEPTRNNVLLGNPAVYPPVFFIAVVPLALLPATAASWLWFVLLGACVLVAMRLLGVRDWRCHVLAVTSPAVVHGMVFGNLTIVLVLLVALAWVSRDRAPAVGLAVGVAVAAKLFVWPLLVWLLITRRFRALGWAVASSVVLVLGAWSIIGFDGLREYPTLLRVVQDVYAVRSVSISTVAGALGAPVSVAVAVAAVAGLLLLAWATVLARRTDGDRRAFAVVVAACIVASPIVWPNYAALLFVPIAITWPRLAPAWFFGYVTWILGELLPKPTATDVCCKPADVPEQAWESSHSEPALWFAAASTAMVCAVAVALVRATRSPDPSHLVG